MCGFFLLSENAKWEYSIPSYWVGYFAHAEIEWNYTNNLEDLYMFTTQNWIHIHKKMNK